MKESAWKRWWDRCGRVGSFEQQRKHFGSAKWVQQCSAYRVGLFMTEHEVSNAVQSWRAAKDGIEVPIYDR